MTNLPRNRSGEVIKFDVGGWLSGPMLGSQVRPTKPGETRLWCSCDPDRRHPFYQASDLVRHVMQARGREAGHEGSTVLSRAGASER